MITQIVNRNPIYRAIAAVLAVAFLANTILPPSIAWAQVLTSPTVLNLPAPGTMVTITPAFTPPMVQGITMYPQNPLEFDFIVSQGDEKIQGDALKEESKKLIKYFLASLTTPENELWVNLSPYEKDRIIPQSFGQTEMGRDLLAQDYILKQLSASLIYPEDPLGKKFWDRVYAKAKAMYGTTNIPMNTFNKIWIVPSKAVVYEHEHSVFVVESHLKVMLEEDYLALEKNLNNAQLGTDKLVKDDAKIVSGVTSAVVREVLLPEIEKEVNEGKTFANLRQIFNSMILATWYKENLKEGLLGQVYADKNKIKGVDVADKEIKEKIYNQYLVALKKGVYNYIKEDYDSGTQQSIPRKYFSGGVVGSFAPAGGIETKTDPATLTPAQAAHVPTEGVVREQVSLAMMTAQQAWAYQEETDVGWALAHDPLQKDVIEAQPITEATINQSKEAEDAFQRAKTFFSAMIAENISGGAELMELLQKTPVYFVNINDPQKLLAILQGRSLPDGHASDRGIHLTKWNALLHELVAFAGREHSESVAFDIIIQAMHERKTDNIMQLLKDSTLNERFRQQLVDESQGFEKTWQKSLETTFLDAGTAIAQELKNGRPADLLTQRSLEQGPNRRDIAMLEEWKLKWAFWRMKTNTTGYRLDGVEEYILKTVDKRSIASLLSRLSDKDIEVRTIARRALEKVGATSSQMVDAYIQALSSTNNFVKDEAIDALGQLGDKRAVGPLIEKLSDKESYIRWSAVKALDKLGEKQAVKPLMREMGRGEIDYAGAGAVAMSLGGEEGQAIQAMYKLLESRLPPDLINSKNSNNSVPSISYYVSFLLPQALKFRAEGYDFIIKYQPKESHLEERDGGEYGTFHEEVTDKQERVEIFRGKKLSGRSDSGGGAMMAFVPVGLLGAAADLSIHNGQLADLAFLDTLMQFASNHSGLLIGAAAVVTVAVGASLFYKFYQSSKMKNAATLTLVGALALSYTSEGYSSSPTKPQDQNITKLKDQQGPDRGNGGIDNAPARGGIDLNPVLWDLKTRRDGNGIPLPLPQVPMQNIHIEGLTPVIINVTTIPNLQFLFGFIDQRKKQENVSRLDGDLEEGERSNIPAIRKEVPLKEPELVAASN